MKAEIISVGSELLLGDVVNTNAAFIAKELTKYGVDCHYQTSVGDNKDKIKSVINCALNRASLLILTGGLGPTPDDITIETIAEFFNVDLVEDEQAKKMIMDYFRGMDRDMPTSNLKQSLRPAGASCIYNKAGTAPGMFWELKKQDFEFLNSDKVIIAFPGVPSEVYHLTDVFLSKYLSNLSPQVIVSRELKFAGISEALLAEKLGDLLEQSNPTIAPYVSKGEPYIRVCAKSNNNEQANELIDVVQDKIIQLVGEYNYGVGEEQLEHAIGKILAKNNQSIAVAESCTGGLISSRLTDVSGSSAYIKLNVVTYSNDSKEKMIKVSGDTLKKYGAVSEQVAKEMAIGVRELAGSDYGISITGIAGPTGATESKPVGLAYVGIASSNEIYTYKIQINSELDRREIKLRFSQRALYYLWKSLIG